MRPGGRAQITAFAVPEQRGAVTRALSLHLRPPPGTSARYGVVSNLRTVRGVIEHDNAAWQQVELCVPAGGSATVAVTTDADAPIPGDLKNSDAAQRPRRGGLLFADLSLADELGSPCRPDG
jgi:hypothetical protein